MTTTRAGLHATVTTLRTILSEGGAQNAAQAREKAAEARFPYPELAGRVFELLQTQRPTLHKSFSGDDISDAFLTLLMDPGTAESLGGGKTHNPWLNVRDILRSTGLHLGTSLTAVYEAVRANGLGYVPTVMEIAGGLAELVGQLTQQGALDPAALHQAATARGLPAWQIALALAWLRRRRGDGQLPTDADLEELLTDGEILAELRQTDGPWDLYIAQAKTLRTLRMFGQSLDTLADALDQA